MAVVQAVLFQGLALPVVRCALRAVGGEAEEGQSHPVGFREGGAVVEGGCSAGATDRHRPSEGEGHAEGVVGGGPFVEGDNGGEPCLTDGLHERGVPGSGTDHYPGEAAVHESGDEPMSGPEGGAGVVHSDH